MGGANFMLHAAGWVEGGLSTSYEKFILDVEMLQMFAELFQPVGAEASDMALDAIAEVGYGGHFFACAHTMERYRTAFYTPLISDWRNYGQWSNDGAKTATERANTICQDTLARYVAPDARPGDRRGSWMRSSSDARRRAARRPITLICTRAARRRRSY